MNEWRKEIRGRGIVRVSSRDPKSERKQFLGVIIECQGGKMWIITYAEESPYHAFADREVEFWGEPYRPFTQHVYFKNAGFKSQGHFRVSKMRLVKVTPDAEYVEVGPEQCLPGRYELKPCDTGETALSFVTEQGIFMVANDPPGVTLGVPVEILAYPVQLSPSSGMAARDLSLDHRPQPGARSGG